MNCTCKKICTCTKDEEKSATAASKNERDWFDKAAIVAFTIATGPIGGAFAYACTEPSKTTDKKD